MPGDEQNELVCVKTSTNRLDVELAKGLLESFGIWSLIKADDLGGTRPHMLYLTPARLYVRQVDLEKAEELFAGK